MKPVTVLTLTVLMCCGTAGKTSLWLSAAVASDNPAGSSAQKPIVLNDCRIKAVKTARLATDRPGVLGVVEPKEGDTVREGDVVAKLQDEVPLANLEVAKLTAQNDIEVRYSEKLNEVDAAEYAKALDANRQHTNTVPNIEVQRLKLAAERSKLQIEKAKHEMAVNALKAKQADAELKTYWIRAPFNGAVSRVEKHPGEAVRQGDSILELVNTDVVQVLGMVSQKDIWRVKPGVPVAVQLSVSDADLDVEKIVFHGQIGFVDVVVDPVRLKTHAWAEIANPGNVLRPGLLATMTIFPAPAANAAANPPLLQPRGLNHRAERVGVLLQPPARIVTP